MSPAVRRPALVTALVLALVGLGVVALPRAFAVSSTVAAMKSAIYQVANPKTTASLVTPWSAEATSAASYGYTQNLGSPFKISTVTATGLVPVQRLYRSKTSDFTAAIKGSADLNRLVSAGYTDQGTSFFAAPAAIGTETIAVDSYVRKGIHRLATADQANALKTAGWSREYTAFHVPAVAQPTTSTSTSSTATSTASATTTSTGTSTTSASSTSTTAAPTTSATASTTASPTTTTSSTSTTSSSSTTTSVPVPPSTITPGSLPVGSAAYPLPATATYVSPTGDDAAAGTAAAPVRTLGRAIALAPAGGTVVLRAGNYHESVAIYKALTIQAYPNEAVWLDGSESVTGWVADGTTWRRDNWTVRFDSSPTYTQGAPDSTVPEWQFVNPNYPMASHPDQLFVDGVAVQQVASRDLVKPGTFFLDESTSQLYLGTDPTGRAVEASTLIRALMVRSADVTIRGIGVRRYSPSVFHIGSVTLEAPRNTVENVIVEDSATTGLAATREDAVLNKVTIRRSGMLGLHGRYADRITVTGMLSTQNNDEHFNTAPVSGGAKFGASRGVTVRGSSFSGNYGHGFWEDCSVYDSTFANNVFNDNTATGLFLEISAKAVVADNIFARNQSFGIKVNNTSDVQIWNNTFVGNGRPLNLVQDSRRNTSPTDQAVDKRIAWPDPTMPWTLGPVTVRNNVVAQPNSSANCLLCVEDYSGQTTAEQMGISADSNVYNRANSTQPSWIVVWSKGAGNPYVFTTLAQAQSTVKQELKGREFVGASILDGSLAPTAAVTDVEASVAEPLPAAVAAVAGQPAGTVHLGAW